MRFHSKSFPWAAVLVFGVAILPVREASAIDTRTVFAHNRLALTAANYGSFGNLFADTSSSLEYPLQSGYEHLTIGGLWVGAVTVDGGGIFTGVSTGAEDAPIGVATSGKTEFTGSPGPMQRRSTSPLSVFYSPDAVSDMDLVATYFDAPVRNGSSPAARPLGIRVRQELYSWSSAAYQDIVFVRYTIVAQANPLTNVWVGVFAELASGHKDGYVNWPPNGNDPSGLGSWFSRKYVSWVPELRLVREHFCLQLPVPDGCVFEAAPPWIGLQLLTPPVNDQSVTVAAWPWGPGQAPHNSDPGRYGLMSAGTIADFTTAPLAPQSGDPVEVLALGPFPTLGSGDSLVVDFAFVGGDEDGDLLAHASRAQRLRDAGFNTATAGVPGPANGPGLRIDGVSPNPSAGRTTNLAFRLPAAGDVRVELYDVSGRRVLEQEWRGLAAGTQIRPLRAPSLAPGVYLVRVAAGAERATARVVLLE